MSAGDKEPEEATAPDRPKCAGAPVPGLERPTAGERSRGFPSAAFLFCRCETGGACLPDTCLLDTCLPGSPPRARLRARGAFVSVTKQGQERWQDRHIWRAGPQSWTEACVLLPRAPAPAWPHSGAPGPAPCSPGAPAGPVPQGLGSRRRATAHWPLAAGPTLSLSKCTPVLREVAVLSALLKNAFRAVGLLFCGSDLSPSAAV